MVGSSNQFNFMSTGGNVFELFDVGLYEGTVAPPFLVPDLASELAVCKRYFENDLTGVFFCGNITNTVNYQVPGKFSVEKRATPTMTLADNGSANGFPAVSGTASGITRYGFLEIRAANVTGNGGTYNSAWKAVSRL
jgi:hypothetical protein